MLPVKSCFRLRPEISSDAATAAVGSTAIPVERRGSLTATSLARATRPWPNDTEQTPEL
jgi:hypothetical protein